MTVTYVAKPPIWCAGCGHFGVLGALKAALQELDVPPAETIVLAGIGCSGSVQNNMGTYGYHALHGRVLPTATGTALANPALTVIAAGGDGDGYAIGAGHLVHTFRRNAAFAYVLMNNATYGLTKGQDSPTAPLVSDDHRGEALDGVLLGLSIQASTFIARAFTRRPDQLVRLVTAALDHSRSGAGFAFLEVLSPCVTYQDTYPAWDAEALDFDEIDGYDPSDRAAAFSACLEALEAGRVPTGLIYRGGPAPAVPDPGPAHSEVEGMTADYQEVMESYLV